MMPVLRNDTWCTCILRVCARLLVLGETIMHFVMSDPVYGNVCVCTVLPNRVFTDEKANTFFGAKLSRSLSSSTVVTGDK